MATDPSFVDHVLEQAGLGDRLRARKMFGEYGFHLDGTFVAIAADDRLFVKPTEALGELGLDLPAHPPYPGAKPYAVADELLDDPDRLGELLDATARRLSSARAT